MFLICGNSFRQIGDIRFLKLKFERSCNRVSILFFSFDNLTVSDVDETFPTPIVWCKTRLGTLWALLDMLAFKICVRPSMKSPLLPTFWTLTSYFTSFLNLNVFGFVFIKFFLSLKLELHRNLTLLLISGEVNEY